MKDRLCAFDRGRDRTEAVHHPLGATRASRGVDDDRRVFGLDPWIALNRLRFGDDRIPGLVIVRRRQWKRDARHALRNAFLDLVPTVELADEQKLRLAVIEDVLDRVGVQRRVESDAHVSRHPDRQVRQDEVSAVLRDQPDVASGLEADRLQVRGHPPHLVHRLRPSVGLHLAVADRLRQPDPIGRRALPVVSVV